MRKRWFFLLIFLLMGSALGYLLTCTALSAWVFGLGHGDEHYARIWKHRIESLPDPETAKAHFSEIQARSFPNGEWVFGVSSDSHGSYWGGTIVIKDSNGKVRVFFGHVCGPHRLEWGFGRKSGSLDEFYGNEDWSQFDFKEQSLP